ncbi:Gfo/Idh/MocA family protein [Amycolatopsis sp. NPDC003676]
MSTVRLGVLGCADVAVRRVLPALARTDSAGLTAVASRDGERAAEIAGRFGGEPVTGYGELLARPDVDAVYVPLPTGLHAEWVRAALEQGKHVLAEKPLTTTETQTRELFELAESRGLVLRENYMFPWHSQHDAVRKQVADGAIGQLRSIRATFTVPRRRDDDIRHDAALGGGSLLDNGGYPVRVARMFLGDDLTVAGASLYRPAGAEVDHGGSAVLRRADGATAVLTFGMDHAYEASYTLHGSTGVLTLDRAYAPPEDHRPVLRVRRQQHSEDHTLPADDQFAASVREFARAVDSARRAGRDEAAAAAAAGAIAQARLIDGIRRCSRQ